MTFGKSARVFVFFLIVAEVASWTIDLPEVRKFVFEKYEKHKKDGKIEYEDYSSNDRKFYSNIEGNSKHNSEHEHSDYNKEENWNHPYMVKKVNEIVHDGSYYLEGLRRSLEDYSMFLMECNGRNIMQNYTIANSTWTPDMFNSTNFPSGFNSSNWPGMNDFNSSNWPGMNDFNSSNWPGMNDFNSSNWMTGMKGFNSYMPMMLNSSVMMPGWMQGNSSTWMPGMPSSNSSSNQGYNSSTWAMFGMNITQYRMNKPRSQSRAGMTCHEATEASENVRRYASLATWATKRLQDLAYAEKYQKTDYYEENELILKLAWFLDRLAYLTGFQPQPKHYLHQQRSTTTPTTSPTPATLVPQTPELNQYLMDCLKMHSPIPATVRCQYPLPLPDVVQQIVGGSQTSTMSPNNNVVPMSDPNTAQSSEILIAADSRPSRSKRSPHEEFFIPIPIHHEHHPDHHEHHEHHEKPKPPIVEAIVKKLSTLKAIAKSVKKHAVADFVSQLALHKDHKLHEHHEHHHHHHRRSIDDDTSQLNILSNDSKPAVKMQKSAVETIHLPTLDVSVVNTKSFKKRSIDDASNNLVTQTTISKLRESIVKTVKKRSTDPLSNLANYYVKYKVWDGANPLQKNTEISSFDVNNKLPTKRLVRRSLFKKKSKHLFLGKGWHLVKSFQKKEAKKGKGKLLSYFSGLFHKKHSTLSKFGKVIKKRSLNYEHLYLPRIPTNPVGDISYYVKNKEGHYYNPNLFQAAQVRAGLEQVFQTGNIAVIRRYGSNYNGNPMLFLTGVAKAMADS